MKKSLIALIVLTACAPKVTSTTTTAPVGSPASAAPAPAATSSDTGGPTARAAVQSFLDAIRAQDIQAMSVLFGTSSGPARDNMKRDEWEKRLIILQCYFNHDKSRFVQEIAGPGAHRIVQFELTRGSIARSPQFYAVPGPRGRWYIDNMEIAAVRDLQARSC